MYNNSQFTIIKKWMLLVVFMVIALGGCKTRPFVYFNLTPDTRNRKKEKDNITVQLQLSSENSIDNTLKIINNRKKSITIMPKNVNLKIKGQGITVPINARYYRLSNRRKKRAMSSCKKSSSSYSCADMVSKFYTGRNRGGVKFGTVDSKSDIKGYIAFKLPDAFCGQEMAKRYTDVFETEIRFIDGVIDIEVGTKRGPVTFEFPVRLEVYYNIEEVPLSRKQY
ncbi:hypothetical protein ACFL5S_00040 [Fibrobacterota bacterium]